MKWPVAGTKEEAIQKYGEQGLLCFLADRDGVQIRNIDPDGAEQVRHLLKSFGVEQVKIYYILLHAALQRTRRNVLIGAADVDKILSDFAKIPQCQGLIRTFLDFESHVSHLFPELKDWASIPCSYFDITTSNGFLAKVHRNLNAFRDQVMTQKLRQTLKGENRVFALVGRSHVVIQEPALRALFPNAAYAVRTPQAAAGRGLQTQGSCGL